MIGHTFLTHTGVYYGGMRDTAALALLTEVNELAVCGIHTASAEIQIAIPADMDKSRMHSIKNHTAKAQEELSDQGFRLESLKITGEKCAAIHVPQVVVTAAGEPERQDRQERSDRQERPDQRELPDRQERIASALLTARAGLDIVYAGWAGLEGMLRIIGEKEAELRERFTPAFIGQMKAYGCEMCGLSKIAAADAMSVSVMRQVSRGGILASLWDLAKDTGLGLELHLKKISVRQETIEVCEYFRLNPYQLASGGSFLMISENGEAVADALKQKGIQAAVIGQLTDSNDKIMHNGEDVRYIDRPAPDELMKIF